MAIEFTWTAGATSFQESTTSVGKLRSASRRSAGLTSGEVKTMGCNPRPLQLSRHGLLRRLGFKVYVLDDEQQIGGILDEIQAT